jgi:2-C-methyl-D-erythritol 4-phosphate cytidylyltransferase
VVLASGSGTRVGAALNKVYLPLAGLRLAAWSLRALAATPGVGTLVVVARPADADLLTEAIEQAAVGPVDVVAGGATRQDSELAALRLLAPRIEAGGVDTVLIHDAARPLVDPGLAAAVLAAARECGGAVPGLPRTDLVAVDALGYEVTDNDLGRVVTVQTPQGFAAAPLLAAYEAAARDGFTGTDTAACVARYTDLAVRCIPGDERNLKVTYPHDIPVAERLLAERTGVPSGPTDW